MSNLKKHEVNLLVTADTWQDWQKRADRFNVKLAAFVRGKVTYYYDQRLKAGGSNGPWDEQRSYAFRDKEPGKHRGIYVKTRLDPQLFEKIAEWAHQEGQDVGPFCSSIMFPIGNDAAAKHFFKGPPPSRAGKKPVKQTEIVIETGRRTFTEADAHTVFIPRKEWQKVIDAAKAHEVTPSEVLLDGFMKSYHPLHPKFRTRLGGSADADTSDNASIELGRHQDVDGESKEG